MNNLNGYSVVGRRDGFMRIEDVIKLAKERGPKKVSVACCQDKEVLLAVENARKEGIISAVLVGDIDKTKEIASKLNIDLDNYELIDIKDLSEASLKAVELVSSKKADIVMKGLELPAWITPKKMIP